MESEIKLNSIQSRACSFVEALEEITERFSFHIEYGDCCMELHDKKSKQLVATVYDSGFEIEEVESEDH
jgi:hypothetical protein